MLPGAKHKAISCRFSIWRNNRRRSKDADTDYNIYFCAGDPELGEKMLEKQQREGVDAHSLAIDPLFVDPANGDFRLRPESPALKLRFIPVDVSKIGLRKHN